MQKKGNPSTPVMENMLVHAINGVDSISRLCIQTQTYCCILVHIFGGMCKVHWWMCFRKAVMEAAWLPPTLKLEILYYRVIKPEFLFT